MKKCRIENCSEKILAKNLCRLHYDRKRFGISLNLPYHPKIRGRTCEHPNCNKKHYGLGMCNSHYGKKLRAIRWDKIIELKGNKCFKCEKSYHRCIYDLHHRDPKKKDFAMGNAIADKPWNFVTKEAEKCDLLCANCHREVHFGDF